MSFQSEATDPQIRRAKLSPARPGLSLAPRPRLMARLDGALSVPLTLVSAPAGFGKTTLLAQWCANQSSPVAWVTADGSDRELPRFAWHVVAALDACVPGICAPVMMLLRQTRGEGAEVGATLSDALRDLEDDVVLIVDDAHLATSAAVESFLGAMVQPAPPRFHLVIATRSDPALPLARMRLLGSLNEIRAADLRFTDDEVHVLLAASGQTDVAPAVVAALQAQTEGWVAGLRLASLTQPTTGDPVRGGETIAGEQHLMDYLVEEVLAQQSESTQTFLLRAALVERISPSLADALLDAVPEGGSRPLLERLSRENLFVEPSNGDGEWYRFHPLFRSLLRRQLELRTSRATLARLHQRASEWFERRELLEQAISHRLAAGDTHGAGALVARHAHRALDREDWGSLSRWLRTLPEALIHANASLLLAQAWVSHFSGRSAPILAMLHEVDALLASGAVDAAEADLIRAERDVLYLAGLMPRDPDPRQAVERARSIVERVSPDHRLAAGLAHFWYGCALHAAGQTDEAVLWLTTSASRQEERIDAGSIRALGGLMFVYRQIGSLHACQEVAHQIVALALLHDLPVAGGWARWMLGWIAYEQDALPTAIEHFQAVLTDHRRVHLHTTCDAMFGLALSQQAIGQAEAADDTLRLLRQIVLEANALEYLPLIRGFEARLALVRGLPERAIDWLAVEPVVTIDSSSLDAFDHAEFTYIKTLLVEGSEASLARAWRAVEELRAWCEGRNLGARLVEIYALAALVHAARGESEPALANLLRSVELAAPGGFVRTYVDLGLAIAPLLAALARRCPDSAAVMRVAGAVTRAIGTAATEADPPASIEGLLTARETEVLERLSRRLSYQEIAEELYISSETVKSHAARIYGKLGAGGRREALAKARLLGWSISE